MVRMFYVVLLLILFLPSCDFQPVPSELKNSVPSQKKQNNSHDIQQKVHKGIISLTQQPLRDSKLSTREKYSLAPEALFAGLSLEAAQAIEKKAYAQLHTLLSVNPSIVNAVSPTGLTLLAWAASQQSIEGVNILLKHGANPNYVVTLNEWRFQILALAAGGMNDALFDLLLQAGADPNSKDNGEAAVYAAIHARRWDRLERLLDAGADLNSESRGGSPLIIYLVKINQYSLVEALIKRGANLQLTDVGGATLADYVRRFALLPDTPNGQAHSRVQQLLRQRGLL